jgi:integrase
MKLTAATIRALGLPEGKADYIHFDDGLPGFGLRLRVSGARTWTVQYAIGGKTRRMALGSTALLDIGQARERAREILARVRLGEDPAREKAEDRAHAAETFAACLKLYLQRRHTDPKLRSRSYTEIERHLLKNLAALHPLRIDAVTRRSIAIELTRITDEGGPVEANRTRASLIKFLGWCAREGLVESNVAQFTNKNPEAARDRVLSMGELVAIWLALPERGDFADIIRLLMLTGLRAREIADLHWDELDPDCHTITIPPGRSKNRREHKVFLAPAASAILRARERTPGRDLVFGTTGQHGFAGWHRAKQRIDEKIKLAKPWIIHDLRRAAATHMGEIGILPHTIEACLNHISGTKGGVAGTYNRAQYDIEKMTAWERWADHLMAAIEGRHSNIATLKRA